MKAKANQSIRFFPIEFQWTFSQPVTSTSLLIALFFKIQDYDSDGLISRYDLLNVSIYNS